MISVTRLSGSGSPVVVGRYHPEVVFGRLTQTDAVAAAKEAVSLVRAGAHVVEMSLAGTKLDEASCLPELVKAVGTAVDVPLCVGAKSPAALDAALAVCPGKPVAFLLDQQHGPWKDFLAVAAKRGSAVLVRGIEPSGVPETVEARIESMQRVMRESISAGVARDDIIVEAVTSSIAGNAQAAADLFNVVAYIAQIETLNQAIRVGDASLGAADRDAFECGLIVRAMAAGITCLLANDVAVDRRSAEIGDVLLGIQEHESFCGPRPLDPAASSRAHLSSDGM